MRIGAYGLYKSSFGRFIHTLPLELSTAFHYRGNTTVTSSLISTTLMVPPLYFRFCNFVSLLYPRLPSAYVVFHQVLSWGVISVKIFSSGPSFSLSPPPFLSGCEVAVIIMTLWLMPSKIKYILFNNRDLCKTYLRRL